MKALSSNGLPAAVAITLLAATFAVPSKGSSALVVAAACKPVTNIEAIVDDSGSMASTDSNRLRVAALDLLISKPQNANKTLGAVEFGSGAASLFAPARIGQNASSMKSTLAAKVRADNGATNYNEAFALAKSGNPNAEARIFLTDGGHNAGTYANGHRGGPPTYVIGLTIGPADPSNPNGTRLQQIADETGGKYYPQQDASTLQATVNEINALIDCQRAPNKVVDTFTKQGQARTHSTSVVTGTRIVELTTTWTDPTNKFGLTGLRIGSTNVVGRSTVGTTYVVVRITNPPHGALQFNVKAIRLVTGKASVITQIARNGSGSTPTAAAVATFVDRIESILVQSAAGRRKLGAVIRAGFSCSISPRAAAQRIAGVEGSRRNILDQLGSLQAPTQQARNVVNLLRHALRLSSEADRHYRDGFLAVSAGARCPLPMNSAHRQAATSDAHATAAKERFVAAFNPLARLFHRRTWPAGKI